MTILFATLFILSVLFFWCTNLLGLPGNWLILLAAIIYAWLIPDPIRVAIGWPTVGTLAALALLGEIIETAASAAGVTKMGGSRRSAVLALVGSVAGAFVGVFVGVPIPVIGSLVAAPLFAGLGAMAGAMLGEHSLGQHPNATWQIGKAAFWGRLLGTFAKTMIGATMAGVAIAAVFV